MNNIYNKCIVSHSTGKQFHVPMIPMPQIQDRCPSRNCEKRRGTDLGVRGKDDFWLCVSLSNELSRKKQKTLDSEPTYPK